MANPYELLAGLALLREQKRGSSQQHRQELQEWSGFQVQIGHVTCLIPCAQVEEVVTPTTLASVRGVAPWISGIIYCRGQLVTLLDAATLLLGKPMPLSAGRVFVLRGVREWFGLQTSHFEGVRHIWSDTPCCEPNTALPAAWERYSHQWLLLDEQPVAVLDATRLVLALESGEWQP